MHDKHSIFFKEKKADRALGSKSGIARFPIVEPSLEEHQTHAALHQWKQKQIRHDVIHAKTTQDYHGSTSEDKQDRGESQDQGNSFEPVP